MSNKDTLTWLALAQDRLHWALSQNALRAAWQVALDKLYGTNDLLFGCSIMKALELIAEVDEQHRLNAVLPEDMPPGRVRVIILVPEAGDVETEGALTADWLAASTSSLQEVWDNEEDAIYDHI